MQINQVLWVINGENQNVIPVRIVEKVTKETASGTNIGFIVETVAGKKISLSSLNGPYFESSLEASNHLLAAATQLIKRIIAKAEEAAQKFGHVEQNVQQNVQLDEEDDTMYQDDPEVIILPDGRQARVRVKLPEAQ